MGAVPGILKPEPSLLVKLGSLIVHYQEWAGRKGTHYDFIALERLEQDPEVKVWLRGMQDAGMLPIKR